jgi:hypothetical protein
MECSASRALHTEFFESLEREGGMTPRRAGDEGLQERYAAAAAKVQVWRNRADQARLAGRKADADRCEDKVRDWASRAKQIEEQLAKRSSR